MIPRNCELGRGEADSRTNGSSKARSSLINSQFRHTSFWTKTTRPTWQDGVACGYRQEGGGDGCIYQCAETSLDFFSLQWAVSPLGRGEG